MVYNDTINLDGIIQNTERMTDLGFAYISGDITKLKEFTAIINRVQHRVWHIIFLATGNWQYDDGNYANMPSATTNLVLGQIKYALPSDALTIHRVEVKDKNDNWHIIYPITKEMVKEGLDEFQDESGTPMYYRLTGRVIEIFPASDYNGADSLKVYFDRDSVDFAYNDTTKTPGFASPYHEILPIKASIEWLKIKQPQSPTLPILIQDDIKLENSIRQFYGMRFKDYKPRVGRAKVSYR